MPSYRIILCEKIPDRADALLYVLPTERVLSAVIIDPEMVVDGEEVRKRREIVLQSHGNQLQFWKSDKPQYDPLPYTLLFPYEDFAWS